MAFRFLTFRPLSAAFVFGLLTVLASAQGTTLDVTQHGVAPRSASGVVTDAGAPVRALVNAIAQGLPPVAGLPGPYRIHFSSVGAGTTIYDFTTIFNNFGQQGHLPIVRLPSPLPSGLDDLVLSGDPANPAELRFHDLTRAGILLFGTRRVRVEHLTLRFDMPPFLQGTIDALGQNDIDTSWVDFRVDPGYALPDLSLSPPEPRVGFARYLLVYEAATQRFYEQGDQIPLVTSGTFVSPPGPWIYRPDPVVHPRTYRMLVRKTDFTAANPSGFRATVGDKAIWKCSLAVAVTTKETDDTVVDRVTIQNSGAAGFFSSLDFNLQLLGCRVKPAAGALMSSAFCGLHCKDARLGPTISGCLFERTGDDGAAIAGTWLELVAQVPGLTYVGTPNALYMRSRTRLQFRLPAPSYAFEFRAGNQTAPRSYQLLKAGVNPTAINYAGTQVWAGAIQHIYEIGFNPADLPLLNIGTDLAACAQFLSSQFSITDTIVDQNRARALYIKASGGVIARNFIRGSMGQGIVVGPEFGTFLEASFVGALTIEDNLLIDVGRRLPDAAHSGAITVSADLPSTSATPLAFSHLPRDNGPLIVRRNTVSSAGQCGLFIGAARSVSVRDNAFLSCQRLPMPVGGGSGYGQGIDDVTAVIHIENSDQVDIRHNAIETLLPSHPSVHISSTCRRAREHGTVRSWHSGFEVRESDETPAPWDLPVISTPANPFTVRAHNGVTVELAGWDTVGGGLVTGSPLPFGNQSIQSALPGAYVRLLTSSPRVIDFLYGCDVRDGAVALVVAVQPFGAPGPVPLAILANDTASMPGSSAPYWTHRSVEIPFALSGGGCWISLHRLGLAGSTTLLLDEVLVR
jgi:hypothetical protein